MKHFFLLAIFCLNGLFLQSQTSFCGSDWAPADPAVQPLHEQLEQQAFDFFKAHAQPLSDVSNPVLTIPVVVHIIHDNGPENISDAQVQLAISWLNDAYANTGFYDQGSGTNVGIQFCLAQRTPTGTATNGITRDQNALTTMTQETQDLAVKNLNRWEPKKYLNIWLVREICSTSAGCGVVGYAYRPEYHGTNRDGLMIEAQFFGAVQSQMSVVAHEIGHYLGLYHTFEGGCTNDNCLTDGDRICDTPPDQSLAAVACGQTVNTCSTDAQSGFSSDQPDMTSNFLDYGNINCLHDFTPGQGARMVFYLNGVRHSLLDSKGCLPPCATPVVSAFTPSATSVSPGQTVTFSNTSQQAGAYQWLVNGVVFSTSTNPSYTFATPGTYIVGLLAESNNAAFCDASGSQVLIQVICGVTADFTVSNQIPAENEPITLTNTSQNATVFSWSVNGEVQGPTLPTLTFSEIGVYTIELTATNGACQSTTQQQIFVQDSCSNKTFQLLLLTDSDSLENWEGSNIAALPDSSFLVLSQSGSLAGDVKTMLTKFAADGTPLWSRQLSGGSNTSQQLNSALCAAPDGGFVLIRQVGENPLFSGQIVKFLANGSVAWSRDFKNIIFTDVKTDAEGQVIAYGNRSFLVKLDENGNIIWTKNFATTGYVVSGKITCLSNGRIMATAFEESTSSSTRTRLLLLDSAGNLLWAKVLNTGQYNNTYSKVIPGPDGSLYLVGQAWLTPITTLASVVKLDAGGQLIWARRYAGASNSISFLFSSGDISSNHGLIIGGATQTNSAFYGSLVGIDSSGHVSWQHHYLPEGQAYLNDIVYLPAENNFACTGKAAQSLTLLINSPKPWVLKADPGGLAGDCQISSFPMQESGLQFSDSLRILTEIASPVSEPALVSTTEIGIQTTQLCAKTCPGNPEICNNNLDDDGDGLFDCLDPDCPCVADKCSPKRNDRWYFGNRMGLDFSTEPPTPLNDGQTSSFEAAATISDEQGNLLFYTDGYHIYNRFHQIMPLGTNPNPPLNQGRVTCVIIPYPGNSSLYYVFINDQLSSFEYALVDMRLDDGRGDVVVTAKFKSLNMGANILLGLAATRSCTFNGYWVTTHDYVGKQWRTYGIDQNGLNPTPILSPTGDISPLTTNQIKFSPTGKLLARLIPGDSVVLYDFEFYVFLAGQFSNPRKFKVDQSVQYSTALEFSATGHYLYISSLLDNNTSKTLYQFDLDLGNPGAIASSKVEIAKSDLASGFSALQLTPNGKIYVAHGGPTFKSIDIIQQPESPGLACQFQTAGITASLPEQFFVGFSNCVATDFRRPYVAFPQDVQDTICQLGTIVQYKINTVHCDVDSIQWKVTGPAVVVDGSYVYGYVNYLAPGQCQLIVQAFTACGSASDTLDITVLVPSNKTLDLGPDRTVCDNGIFTFNAGSGFASYRWQNGSPDSILTTLLPGKYWVDVLDGCGNRQTDTVLVKIAPNSTLSLGADLKQCAGQSLTFQRPVAFSSWQWSPALNLSCDTCATVVADPSATTTWTVLAQTTAGCLSLDTLHWTIVDTLFYSRDTAICVNQTLDIYGINLPADTTALFLLPNAGPGCDTLLTLQVLGLETFALDIQTRICAQDSIRIYNTILKADTTAVFYRPGPGCDTLVMVVVKSYPPLTISLPADTSIFVGASIGLPAMVQGSGPLTYNWQPDISLTCADCPQPVASPLLTTVYTLQVQDENGCTDNDSIQLRVNPECRLMIPNAFTPNGDGVNDWFYPLTDPCVRTVRLWRVFNRWGQQVFERRGFAPNQENLGWDGQVDGKAASSDVLVWTAELEYYDGRVEQRQGEVTLLR